MAGIAKKSAFHILKRLVEKRAVEINEFVRPVIAPKDCSLYTAYPDIPPKHPFINCWINWQGPQTERMLERYLELAESEGIRICASGNENVT